MVTLLELPEIKPIQRRNVQNPDLSLLLGDQPEGFERLKKFMEGNGEVFVLSGPAGTGKTTLMSFFNEYLLYTKSFNVVVTAPTNKAVKVNEYKAQYTSPRLDYMTTHRLLGLREVIKPDGKRTFKPQFGAESKIDNFHLIEVDECSLVGKDLEVELFDQVYQKKLIFIGDHRQLPPIGEKISPIFDKYLDGTFEGFTLEKILRQAEGSPIIQLSQSILQDPKHIDMGIEDTVVGDMGYYSFRDGKSFREEVLQHFLSNQFSKNADYCKLIAWTNEATNNANQFIRKNRYGNDASQLMPGEHLITKAPVFDLSSPEENIMFHTNDDLEVIEYEKQTLNMGPNAFKYWRTKVRELDFTGMKYPPKMINVIADESRQDFNNLLEKIAKVAKLEKEHSKKSAYWREFYRVQKQFADVTYNSAITCHRAQGSTYMNTFLLYGDMARNPEKSERKSMIYTAITRSSHRLFIYG